MGISPRLSRLDLVFRDEVGEDMTYRGRGRCESSDCDRVGRVETWRLISGARWFRDAPPARPAAGTNCPVSSGCAVTDGIVSQTVNESRQRLHEPETSSLEYSTCVEASDWSDDRLETH